MGEINQSSEEAKKPLELVFNRASLSFLTKEKSQSFIPECQLENFQKDELSQAK